MKYISLFILVTLLCGGKECDWHSKELPMAREDKSLYQIKCWPVVKRVRVPNTAELKDQLDYQYKKQIQEIRIKEIKRGSLFFILGLCVAGAGFLMHFLTAYPKAQRLSEWVLSAGLCGSAMGLIIKKASEYQNWILLGLSCLLVVFVLYKCRGWSVSHIIKKTYTKTNNNDTADS